MPRPVLLFGDQNFQNHYFFETIIFFQIHNSFGGGHYKYLVLFQNLFRLIETLFFYGAIYKKKTHYVLLILNQNWALVILCGSIFFLKGAHFFNIYFFGACLEILVFFLGESHFL